MFRILISLNVLFLGLQISTQGQHIWRPLGGPGGGDMLEIHKHHDGSLLAVLRDRGILRSRNNGVTWSTLAQPLPEAEIKLAIGSSGRLFALGHKSLYRSNNMGASWLPVNIGPIQLPMYAIASGADGAVFLATGSSVWRSLDQGVSWHKCEVHLGEMAVSRFYVDRSEELFALAFHPRKDEGAILRSVDGGYNWRVLIPEDRGRRIGMLHLAADSKLYAGSGTGRDAVLLRSDDKGESWLQLQEFGECRFGAMHEAASGRLLLPLLCRNSYRLLQSDNEGQTWSAFQGRNERPFFNQLISDNDGGLIAATPWGAMYSGDDGANWYYSSCGLNGFPIKELCVKGSDTILAASYHSGMLRSVDGGDTWRNVAAAALAWQAGDLICDPDGRYYYSTIGGGVFESSDHGESWRALGDTTQARRVFALGLDRSNALFAAVDEGIAVFRSERNEWEYVKRVTDNQQVRSLASTAAGTLISIFFNDAVYRSTNSGADWDPLPDLLPTDLSAELYASPSGMVYIHSAISLYRTSNLGESWQDLSTVFPKRTIVIGGTRTRGIFVATASAGVFHSADYGLSWQAVNEGLNRCNIRVFRGNERGEVFAGSARKGIFKLDSRTSLTPDMYRVPGVGSAREATGGVYKVQCELAHPGTVDFSIYNLRGMKIALPFRGTLPRGRHLLSWNATSTPAGTYFYVLSAGDASRNGQIMVRH